MIRPLACWFHIPVLLAITFTVHAQWRGPVLTELGPSEGLPSIVNDMVADSTGYMYFATNVGLYKYDGHSFTLYSHDPMDETSIGSDHVLKMIVGRDGLIWMALLYGGVNSFDPSTERFSRYPLPQLPYRNIPAADALYEDAQGTLWVGGHHFRLLALDRLKGDYTTYTPDWINAQKHRGRLAITSITPDPHQAEILWLSVLDYASKEAKMNSFGLVRFNKLTHTFEDTPYAGIVQHVDTAGVMWGKHWGNFIFRFDPATMAYDTFEHHLIYKGKYVDPITRDMIAYKDRLLIASSLAILEFDGKQFTNIQSQDLEDEIYKLYSDPNENLWIGTSQGALVINPEDQHIRFFALDLFGVFNRIFPGRLAFDADADQIYLSHTHWPHPSGYFSIPLGEKQKDNAVFHPTSFPVQGIAVDNQNQLWCVGGGTIYRIDKKTHALSRSGMNSDNNPLSGMIYMQSNAQGWVGMIGLGEFVWFHCDSQKLNRLSLHQLPGSAFAKSLGNGFEGFTLTDHHTAYLFSNEAHTLDLITGECKIIRYDPIVNPHAHSIQYIGEDQMGNVWMSTNVHIGKYHLCEDSLILQESYGKKQGLLNSGARELHIDHAGRVWVFTASGLNAIEPATGAVHYFGTNEGLPFPFLDPRQVLSISDGRIATVCHNGMIVFSADDLWQSGTTDVESIVWKRIRIDGKELLTGVAVNSLQYIDLPPGNKGIDIEFQALAFPNDDRTTYSYRIIGLQEEWISIGGNQLVTVPSLMPGNYVFEIKTGNAFSAAPARKLAIHVKTPLYQRIWFISLIMIAAAGMIYMAIQYRIRRIREQEEERTAINKQIAELELKALRSQMNPHFMFNSLNSIKNYILRAEPKLAAEYLSSFAHLIRLILQNSKEKTISLKDELETLLLYIELEQLRFDNQFSFQYNVDDNLPLDHIQIPPMLLQPFIENAIWHGLMHKKEAGHLRLSFEKTEDMVACIIDDDGVGREKAAEMKSLSATRYKSMGMRITHDRIEIMNKMDALGITCEVIDKKDHNGLPAGTQVIVRIPYHVT